MPLCIRSKEKLRIQPSKKGSQRFHNVGRHIQPHPHHHPLHSPPFIRFIHPLHSPLLQKLYLCWVLFGLVLFYQHNQYLMSPSALNFLILIESDCKKGANLENTINHRFYLNHDLVFLASCFCKKAFNINQFNIYLSTRKQRVNIGSILAHKSKQTSNQTTIIDNKISRLGSKLTNLILSL